MPSQNDYCIMEKMAKHTSLNKSMQHEILATTPESAKRIKGFHDSKHPERPPMMMDRYNRMILHDDGIAQEIDDRFGTKSKGGTGEVVVVTTEDPVENTRTFTVGHMPWKKEKQ